MILHGQPSVYTYRKLHRGRTKYFGPGDNTELEDRGSSEIDTGVLTGGKNELIN